MAARLTKKQQRFIDEYFKANMNATEAAARVYDVKDRASANAIGAENLAKPSIRDEIEKRLATYAMTANEVLFLLAEHARANVDELLDTNGTPSVAIAREKGKMHLIKKIKTKTFKIGEETVIEQELEIHDSQSALVQLGRYHKLFTDKREVELGDKTRKLFTKDELEDLTDEQLAAIAARRTGGSG
jgi:phage terminase small subunit